MFSQEQRSLFRPDCQLAMIRSHNLVGHLKNDRLKTLFQDLVTQIYFSSAGCETIF